MFEPEENEENEKEYKTLHGEYKNLVSLKNTKINYRTRAKYPKFIEIIFMVNIFYKRIWLKY